MAGGEPRGHRRLVEEQTQDLWRRIKYDITVVGLQPGYVGCVGLCEVMRLRCPSAVTTDPNGRSVTWRSFRLVDKTE